MTEKKYDISKLMQTIHDGSGSSLRIYFLGIGGIGMSAIARYFSSKGVFVSGYDKTSTALTAQLKNEGIVIHYTDDVNLADIHADLVVYTPAIPKDHTEFNYFLNHDFVVMKRSEVLGLITKSAFNICVAGTHGKTTTSTMIAHILRHSGYGCNAFLGGIATNYNTNFWSSEKNVVVVEADEYDRSFLQLNPDIAVITAVDPDHLDIYHDADTFRDAFVTFSKKVKDGGCLLIQHRLHQLFSEHPSRLISYDSVDSSAACHLNDVKIIDGVYHFEVLMEGLSLGLFELPMGGMHNVENALAAITVAHLMGIDNLQIKEAVANFRGVKRRFEYVLRNKHHVMIDDYAHHPQELEALIKGVKALYPEKRCAIVFQPHLYSRTRDFADGFAASLSLADEVVLLPIYPARELPIKGVESEMLLKKMDAHKTICCSKEQIGEWLTQKKKNNNIEVLITAGAGDIDTLVEPLKNRLLQTV